MSQRILLQTLLKFRDRIKDGSAKVQDIITDYFNQTGKSVTDEERAFILDEFAKEAPDNVTTLEGVDAVETILPTRGPNVQRAGDMSDTPFTDTLRQQNPDVEIRGDEGFDELLEKLGPSKEEGIGSMIPKEYFGYNRGKGGEYTPIPSPLLMDDIIASERPLDTSRIKNQAQRDEFAKFIRKMRGEDFENPTIKKIVKDSGGNIGEGKRAATTLARAADMVADTKVKQEVLSDLDELKLDKGPRWWKGDEQYDSIEGPMGTDTRAEMIDQLNSKIYRGVMEDLDKMIGEDKSYDVLKNLGNFSGNRGRYADDPNAFVQAIKEEIEFNDVKYDMRFWENYVNEIMQLTAPVKSRFMFGGVV